LRFFISANVFDILTNTKSVIIADKISNVAPAIHTSSKPLNIGIIKRQE